MAFEPLFSFRGGSGAYRTEEVSRELVVYVWFTDSATEDSVELFLDSLRFGPPLSGEKVNYFAIDGIPVGCAFLSWPTPFVDCFLRGAPLPAGVALLLAWER